MTNDGGPAFPFLNPITVKDAYTSADGMSLRDYLAVHADIPWDMVKANCYEGCSEASFPKTDAKLLKERARLRYLDAEAMLSERERRRPAVFKTGDDYRQEAVLAEREKSQDSS